MSDVTAKASVISLSPPVSVCWFRFWNGSSITNMLSKAGSWTTDQCLQNNETSEQVFALLFFLHKSPSTSLLPEKKIAFSLLCQVGFKEGNQACQNKETHLYPTHNPSIDPQGLTTPRNSGGCDASI